MASLPPTPSTLRNWEEAFAHPLPVVRKLETQLRTTISDNQNKLRSLVGASYRDLLGTAERIVEMDSQIRLVESNLTGIGRKCDYRVFDKAKGNLEGMRRAGREGRDRKMESMARLKVLKGMLDAVSRVVRKDGDALVGAKLLVLARMLHKSVAENADMAALADELKRKLVTLRRKLLAYIDRCLVRPTSDRTTLLGTLTAYAVLTNSAAKDVLRHFLQLRYAHVETSCETATEESVLDMLELYSQTLVATRAIFPARFGESLAQLSRALLVQDPQIAAMQELHLDIYAQWVSEEISRFTLTPPSTHESLASADVAKGMKVWARQVTKVLSAAVRDCLDMRTSIVDVLGTRRKVLGKFLEVNSKIPSEQFSIDLDEFRAVFVARLEELATQTSMFSLPALTAASSTFTTSKSAQFSSPWQLASTKQPIDSRTIRTNVLDFRHGRQDTSVKQTHDALTAWLHQLDNFWANIATMRTTKWDDDTDYDLEDLDYEGDESLQDVLRKTDAAIIEDKLKSSTAAAFRAAYMKVEAVAEKVEGGEVNAAQLVRILRELDRRRLALGARTDAESFNFGSNVPLIASLHVALAQQVAAQPLQDLFTHVTKSQRRQHAALSIVRDDAGLPIQLSPAVFSFMCAMQRQMADMGADLWSPGAVRVMKGYLGGKLAAIYGQDVRSYSEAEHTNGEDGKGEDNDAEPAAEEPKPDESAASSAKTSTGAAGGSAVAHLQRWFDVLYLSLAFDCPPNEKDSENDGHDALRTVLSRLRQDAMSDKILGDDEGKPAVKQQKLEQNPREYWKRTYLLFGLLAS
jgi:hypothetical protein